MKVLNPLALIATNTHSAITMVTGIALVGCAWMSALFPTLPITLEDFSALLAADTFASGRLANPPHPFARHFDHAFVLQTPNYVSTFPPLPGAALALGQLLGEPLYGVALSFALACTALYCMLRAWPAIGPKWAMVGALLTSLHPQILAYWGIGYTGGAVGLLGGALLYGGLFRLLRAPAVRDGLILGAGAGVLVSTQPYEGAVACVPAAGRLLYEFFRGPRQLAGRDARLLGRALLPGAAVLIAALLVQGYYNHETTGRALTTPRQAYDRAYASVPDFLFQERPPHKTYNTVSLERLYADGGRQTAPYLSRRSLVGFLAGIAAKAHLYLSFFTSMGFIAIALAVPFVWRDVRFAALAWVLFGVALAVETFEAPHFAAPFAALGIGIAVVALRRVWELRWGQARVGVLLAAAIVAVTFAEQLEAVDRLGSQRQLRPMNERPLLVELVEKSAGRHLVLVKYGYGHSVRWDWAINRADIDASKVVWALELEPESTKNLVNYFADRTVWLLRSSGRGIEINPYPPAERWKTAKLEESD